MSEHLEKMRTLVRSLPKNDDILGLKFINTRNFRSLLELVESDIYLVLQEQEKESPKEKFKNIDLDKLLTLKVEVKDYLSYLEPDDDYYEEDF